MAEAAKPFEAQGKLESRMHDPMVYHIFMTTADSR